MTSSRDVRFIQPKMWTWILQEGSYPMMSSTRNLDVKSRIPNAVRLAVMRIHKNLGHPSNELLCRALRIDGANRIAIRAVSELKCDVCWEKKPPNSQLLAKLADTYAEFNQGVGVVLFMLADLDEQVFEYLKTVDLPTRF